MSANKSQLKSNNLKGTSRKYKDDFKNTAQYSFEKYHDIRKDYAIRFFHFNNRTLVWTYSLSNNNLMTLNFFHRIW